MKKIISILGTIGLIATSTTPIISCQNNKNKTNQDPFYQLPTKRPTTINEVKEIIGYYYDLNKFYNNEYWTKDWPKKIYGTDSENFQKMKISYYITDFMCGYAYIQLDYKEDIKFITPNGEHYFNPIVDKEALLYIYIYNEVIMKDKTTLFGTLTQNSKDWLTTWYNWVLETDK